MAGRKDISASDSELFRQSVGPVKKIRQDSKPLSVKRARPVPLPKSTTTASETRPVTAAGQQVGVGDVLCYRGPGVQLRVFNRLRKGRYDIEKELDLHGTTAAKGRQRLFAFLEQCNRENIRCIRIIHGKGRGSRDRKPVIKNMLNDELRNHDAVLAFTSAPANDGGAGVAYVLLKKQGE